MLPDRSLSTAEYTKGTKKARDRITVALCCNSDGSEKMKPFVIGKALKPRCFRNFNVILYANYTATKKAWMTMVLFNDWLKSFNCKMRNQIRKVLLIMDKSLSAKFIKCGDSLFASYHNQSSPATRCWYYPVFQGTLS